MKHIYQDKYCFIVEVKRRKRSLMKCFAKRLPNALALAISYRDAVVRSNPLNKIRTKALSNTGHVGISETVRWSHSIPYSCFQVTWPESGAYKHRWIYFGKSRYRVEALKAAIKLRREKTK